MAKEIKKIKADDSREEEIEIDKGELKDEAKLKRWDGECYIKIGRKEKDIKTEIEGNVFKFDVKLKKKPKNNIVSFDIESKNLKFYYQRELTQEEKDEGCYRPENVIGSYAVYHATRGNFHSNQLDADKYKCGIAFHIYRPKIIDANENWIWGKLNISGGSLTITVEQTWLDNAVYPVTVDPNFGYETKGGTEMAASNNYMYASGVVAPASAGTATSITVWIKYLASGRKVKCALYRSSDQALHASTAELEIGEAQDDWHDFSVTGGGSIEEVNYFITFWGTYFAVYYNDLGVYYWYDGYTYNGWPEPGELNESGTYQRTFSCYSTYSEGEEGYTLEIGSGSFTETGQTVNLLRDGKLGIGAGSYAETGQTVALLKGFALDIGAGSYLETGQAVSLLKGFYISIGAGTYTWTGFTVTLTKSGAEYTITIVSGTFALTGSSVTLVQKDGDYTIPRPVETDYVELTKPPTDYSELSKTTTDYEELTKPSTDFTELEKPTTSYEEE